MAGVDWSTEWFTSILWVAGVTVAAAVACVLAAWALTRWTVWGRQLKRLAMPYFSPRREQGWRTLLNTLGILVLAIVAVRVQVVNSYIVNGLYTALQQLDAAVFLRYVGIFAVLSVVALAETLLSFYLQQRLVIHWRVWLNDRIPARLARRRRLPPRPASTKPSTSTTATSPPSPEQTVRGHQRNARALTAALHRPSYRRSEDRRSRAWGSSRPERAPHRLHRAGRDRWPSGRQ